MTQKLKVFVFDDVAGRVGKWIGKLKRTETFTEQCEAIRITTDEFQEITENLLHRRNLLRSSDPKLDRTDLKGDLLDTVDILLIDYDIFNPSTMPKARVLSGEEFAYLARCYSKCGLIVGINFNSVPPNGFDLTLKGHLESFVDLNVGDKQISNPGLWSDDQERWEGFRPWFWPVLPRAWEKLEVRTSNLRDNLDANIFDHLNIPNEIVDVLPMQAVEFLTKYRKKSPTFRDFVEKSGHGLRSKDRTSEEFQIRIAGARIWKWLERYLLAGQEVLVDAPHLAFRIPGLVRGSRAKLESWDAVSHMDDPRGLDTSSVDGCRFEMSQWLSRPAWFWPLVRELDLPIPEVPDFVFCEDVSSFRNPRDAKTFLSDVPSQYIRRFIAGCPGVDYYPKRYLLT